MAKALYKFYWYCGRAGEVESVFVADKSKVDEAIGRSIYFGEILGKHSEIYGVLEENDLTIVTENENVIAALGENFSVGNNPLDYIE